jgi:SAM-dependent methyltransferase
MKPAKVSKTIDSPVFWHDFAGGQWLMEQEQNLLDQYLPTVFGYHLLKLGILSSQLNCHASTIRHQVNLAQAGKLIGVQADLDALPFQESSIDVCLLSHCLDFSADPHQILREVERVLTGDGYVVISGFNPVSLIGLRRYFPYRRRDAPWGCRMFTPGRVKDWLHLLGFEVVADERFGFNGFVSERVMPAWLERRALRYCRAGASVYFMVARKRRTPLTPVRKRWHVKRSLPAPMAG